MVRRKGGGGGGGGGGLISEEMAPYFFIGKLHMHPILASRHQINGLRSHSSSKMDSKVAFNILHC